MGFRGSRVQIPPSRFWPAQRAKIERSDAERRKETKSFRGREGWVDLRGGAPRSPLSFLLSGV
jgi:hypothetical protein